MSRIIAHVDMDAFFASVEQQANPFLRDKPIGVTGKRKKRSVIAAASIEAKRRGVKTAMPTWEAKRLCPDIELVHGDPKKYRHITEQFNALFHKYSDCVERFSIDESFLNLTGHVTDFMEAGCRMAELKTRIQNMCGSHIVASVGIGPNKLVAKLASDYDKPDGLTVVCPRDVTRFMDTLALTDICGIGSRTANKLNNIGIQTVRQLRDYPLDALVATFKSYGYFLHEAAHGRDGTHVEATKNAPKSMGHSYTLPRDTTDKQVLWSYLLGLADKVGWRLRRDGYRAQRVYARVRFADFTSTGKQIHFQEPTDDGLTLARIAWRMMRLWVDEPIRLVGITASALVPSNTQTGLFMKDQKTHALTQALDRVTKRYGTNSWTRASLIRTHFAQRSTGFIDE